jgi:hypothetical protein
MKTAPNGVAASDVPVPPAAMMAAQRAFEATPLVDTTPGTPAAAAAANAKKGTVPPPPPMYVPTPARAHLAPQAPSRASTIPTAPVVPVAPASSPRPAPSSGKLPPDASAGLAALDLQVARTKTKEADAPSSRRPADDADDRPTAVPGEAKPPPMALASLVKSAPPPPLPARAASKPPPPKSKAPPKPMSKPPPPVKAAPPEMIEELSGSVLLTDASGSNSAITELSGSMLLPDLSAAVSPAQALQAVRAAEELTGSFLVDAGSTGALPSVESTGQILAAKAAARAPFAADLPDQTATVPKVIVPPDEAATVVIPPSGATPPPSTAHTGPAVPPAGAFTPAVPPVGAQPGAEPLMVAAPAVAPEHAALPTFVGVPPPPDALVRQQEAFEASLPKVEISSEHAPAAGAVVAPVADYVPSEPLPPPERSTARLHDFRENSRDPRAKYIVPAVGVVGLVAMMGLIGLVVGALRKKPSDEPPPVATTLDTAPSAKVTAASAPSPSSAPAPAPAAAPTSASPGAACTLAGAAHVVAPRAVVQSGVEANVVAGHIALGFATRDRDGIAVQVDPSSLAATHTARAHVHTPDAIRRLVPIQTGDTFSASADVDHAGDFLAGRRTVAAPAPFDLGFGGGGVSWAPHHSSEADLVWTLDGDAPVEAIRAAALDPTHDDAGWAIAFRRGTSIYAGAVSGGATRTPKGPLVSVAGLGAQVGSPAIAAQDGAVVVAWADRAQPSDPWSLRWMRFAPGDATADAKGFVPSEGGLGEHAMSPAIAAAGSGRFVLAWTEGPVSNHQVRAQTITAGGVPIGVAMSISDSGVNAGQAQVAILPDGHGVVAYLASSGGGPKSPYEVLATPIACP